MAQSSVEWLQSKLKEWANLDSGFDTLFEQAKAMHKEENEESYMYGTRCINEGWAWTDGGIKEIFESYYTKTFGKSEK